MDVVIDASAILAVLLNEPERDMVVNSTKGSSLVAPASLVYEVGNALSSLMRRQSISMAEAVAVYHAFARISIRLIEPDMHMAILVSGEEGIYAYDAYFIVCAERMGMPMLTLDRKLADAARRRGVELLEA
jgi:predicted nucleic acid-binding protein